MNQNFFDNANQKQQLYKALSKYNGPTTSTPSILSEYLSSAKTQTSHNKNNSNKVKPLLSPQNITKPIQNDSLRIKTSTLHFPQKQPVSHHIKSLSSDIKLQPQPPMRRRGRQERMIFQSDSQQAPFLIIQNKVRDSRRFDTLRKSTLPSLQLESQKSIQNTTPRITDIPLVPIQQVTEIQDSKSQLYQEADKIYMDQVNNLDDNQFLNEDKKASDLFNILKRKYSITEANDINDPQILNENQEDIIQTEKEVNIDDDEIQSSKAMKKLSVKMKFKNAVSQQVQNMFKNRELKSLFTVIISPEFSSKHEEERQKISDQYEQGNFILAKNLKTINKDNIESRQTMKCIKDKYNIRHNHKINTIIQNQLQKLNTTNKAFQRKISMIKGTQWTTKECDQPQQQQFSLLNKFKKQSVNSNHIGQGQALQNNFDQILPNLMDDANKITITITNTILQNTILEFNKPKFVVHMETIIDEQVIQPISPPRKAIQHSSSLHSSFKFQKIQNSASQSVIINKDHISNHNVYNSILNTNTIEDNSNLDFNQEYSKSNLYVRLYYQNRLHKIPQKISYTQHNLKEIEDIFYQYISMITGSQISFQTSQQHFTKQVKSIEKSNLVQESQIFFEKYDIPQIRKQFSFDFENSISLISSQSDQSNSFDQILEEPNNRLQVDERHESKMKNIIQSMKNLSDDSESQIFVEDVVNNQKQISTGLLNTIKKVKNKFHFPLNIQVIMSVLDQSTKNDLLTFQMMEQSEEQIQQLIHGDCDTNALTNLDSFYQQQDLRNMILNGIEIRYENILIGRYQGQQRMIDPEHSDLVQSTILEAPQQHISSSQQSQQSQQSSEYQQLQKQKLISLKQQGRSRNLQRDSLTVIIKPKLNSKHTVNSPDVTNVHSKPTSQYTNQLTYNIFTQASTQYLTKPTNQSQQSVKVSSVQNLEENLSQLEMSPQSSLKSIKSKSAIDSSNIISQTNPPKIKKSQKIKDLVKVAKEKLSHPHPLEHIELKDEIITSKKQQLYNVSLLQQPILENKTLSMFSYSLRMRNQALGHNRRQNLDQFKILEQLIYDNDFQEFFEHLQQVPQMYIDRRLQNNDTLLILASKSGCKDMVKELIKKGADINIQNQDDGNTAVHLALSYGHYKIADILIRAGANTNILNNIGKNAWSIL
ncbi:unnamed protein product [Paramecium pentaurelia]|uniref:Uncharacterized protein n=1 Tax=Paramecium pentaurelia TaxID=43138 RepID=A0A8S1VZ01_9CILI|nr:unnamed protein product [Paramecium pentaurelia]